VIICGLGCCTIPLRIGAGSCCDEGCIVSEICGAYITLRGSK
jgi:hypothetical protein